MKIAIVTPVFPPYKGGIGAVAEAQANALKAIGHEVRVFAPSTARPLFAYGNAAVMPGLVRALKGFDIIHVHYPCYGMDIFSAIASVIWRTPLVLTYHMKAVSSDWRNVIFSIHRAVIEPIIFAVAKCVFVSSSEYAQEANIKHKRLIQMPFGVDATRFSPGQNSALRETLGIPREALNIIFVGGLDKAHDFKGVDVLLRALLMVPTSVHLTIVGSGDLKPFYEKLAVELMINERVHFLGGISAEELPGAYRSADVHVLPAINRGEAFGLVTLEAAASGLPSIVSDLPGVRTLVDAKRTGYVAKAGDPADLALQICRFVEHPEDAVIMGAAARARVMERYDNSALARSLLQAYNGILQGER
ncbi:MAG: glycosyltransferase family 4 protein [Patescibacteria group bacterium]|jgi:glycosyltransferase involved in cell wall biosynthesis